MNYRILTTEVFEHDIKRLVKKHRSIKKDVGELLDNLENDPFQGNSLGKSCYKIRLAITSKRQGKSGGARVITYVYVSGKTVYLLSIYDKSKKSDLTSKELQELLAQISI